MPHTDDIASLLQARQQGHEYAELFDFPPRLLDGVEIQAFERYKVGRYDEAEALLRGVIVADSRRYYPQLLLAEVLLKNGRIEQARAAIERAFELEPEDPSVRLKLAEILMHTGDDRRVRPHLEYVIAHTEPDGAPHLRAAAMLRRLEG